MKDQSLLPNTVSGILRVGWASETDTLFHAVNYIMEIFPIVKRCVAPVVIPPFKLEV